MSDTPKAGAGGTGDRGQAVVEAAERAASEILADATRDAERRIADARGRAEAVGRERVEMMSALSDSLLEQATTVKRQADILIEALDRVIATLEHELERPARPGQEPAAAPRRPAPRRLVGRPPPAARPPAPPPRQPVPPPAPAPSAAPQGDPSRRGRPLDAIRDRVARGETKPPDSPAPARPPKRAQDPQRPPRKPVSEGTAEGARILATQMAVAGSTRAEILVRLRKEFGIQDPEPIVDGVIGGGEGPGAA